MMRIYQPYITHQDHPTFAGRYIVEEIFGDGASGRVLGG